MRQSSSNIIDIEGHKVHILGGRSLNVVLRGESKGCYCENEHEASRLLEAIKQSDAVQKSFPSSRCADCKELSRNLFGLNKRFLCAECYEAEYQEIGGGA